MNPVCWKSLLAVSALAAATCSPVFARRPGSPAPVGAGSWKVIGATHASHAADHDGLIVKGPFDDFRAVKFKVTDALLNMMQMVVTYENGQPDRIEVRENIPKGGESRVIDLKGRGTRRIRRVDFWYDTKGLLNGKADVTVFGKK
jgi:hypothetical protein